MTNSNNKQCVLCLDEYTNQYVIHQCKHAFCDKCFQTYIQTLILTGSRRLEDFRCPQATCKELISQKQLETNLQFSLFNKITNRIIYQHTVMCPNCGERADFSNTQQFWQCNICYSEICRYCKSLPHEGNCQDNVTYFNEVRATFQDNQEIGYCPQCNVPFLKDENCDHVTCDNPDCGFEFCFGCSVTFSPINNHGGNFHRSDCRNFEYYEQYQPTYYEQCLQCSRLGYACQPPIITKQKYLLDLIHKIQGVQVIIPLQPEVQAPKQQIINIPQPVIEPIIQCIKQPQIEPPNINNVETIVKLPSIQTFSILKHSISQPLFQFAKVQNFKSQAMNQQIKLNEKEQQLQNRIDIIQKRIQHEMQRLTTQIHNY